VGSRIITGTIAQHKAVALIVLARKLAKQALVFGRAMVVSVAWPRPAELARCATQWMAQLLASAGRAGDALIALRPMERDAPDPTNADAPIKSGRRCDLSYK